MLCRQICWNIQNYWSQQGLKRTRKNKGNCLWCSSGCTLHCLQKQSTPELIVQFRLKKPQTNKKPKSKQKTSCTTSEPLSICLPVMMVESVLAQLQTLLIPTVTFRNSASSLAYITFDDVIIFKFSNWPYGFYLGGSWTCLKFPWKFPNPLSLLWMDIAALNTICYMVVKNLRPGIKYFFFSKCSVLILRNSFPIIILLVLEIFSAKDSSLVVWKERNFHTWSTCLL